VTIALFQSVRTDLDRECKWVRIRSHSDDS